ncbi:hypothetical protein RclHR1_10450004 [Rhizophagus clarus]|uniref:Uncharacterized protein n=1 Tax=Rhizophagus clarus TaxID=94130 RepID=A0A2Z6QG77_9GLOM|nr:hypothetical protein RclHR1_10450004 [Rhizophagus clarus]
MKKREHKSQKINATYILRIEYLFNYAVRENKSCGHLKNLVLIGHCDLTSIIVMCLRISVGKCYGNQNFGRSASFQSDGKTMKDLHIEKRTSVLQKK